MCRKTLLAGMLALAVGAVSVRADVMGFISCSPGESSSVTLPGATAASLACGEASGLAQGSVEINVFPDLRAVGGASGELTIPAACDITQLSPSNPWLPPECPLPYIAENPNVRVYFNAAVTATGYTGGTPRPGYLVWSVSDPTYGLSTEEGLALVALEGPSGVGLWATIGPYSIEWGPNFCVGGGPDGYWGCGPPYARPFELGVPFEVRYAFEGYAWMSTYPQSATFEVNPFNMKLTFLEVDDVIGDTGLLFPAPGARPVPAHLVPEPPTLWLMAGGVFALFAASWRRRSRGIP